MSIEFETVVSVNNFNLFRSIINSFDVSERLSLNLDYSNLYLSSSSVEL